MRISTRTRKRDKTRKNARLPACLGTFPYCFLFALPPIPFSFLPSSLFLPPFIVSSPPFPSSHPSFPPSVLSYFFPSLSPPPISSFLFSSLPSFFFFFFCLFSSKNYIRHPMHHPLMLGQIMYAIISKPTRQTFRRQTENSGKGTAKGCGAHVVDFFELFLS